MLTFNSEKYEINSKKNIINASAFVCRKRFDWGSQLSAQEQSKRFSVKVDNITLKEAIEVIKKQGNYSFLIRNNDIDLNRKVSVNINNGTINDVMGQLLAGTDVSYEVNGYG